MTDRIRRIDPNPSGRRWGQKTRDIVTVIRDLVAIGDIFTYAMCQDLCGSDLQQEGHLRESVRLCCMEYGIVLDPVPGVGSQRLSEPGKVDRTEGKIKSQHRAARRSLAEQTTVDMQHLSELDRHRYLVHQSILGHVSMHTDPQRLHELVERREVPALPVPFDIEAHKDVFRRKPPA
jgi:hypothetical protein